MKHPLNISIGEGKAFIIDSDGLIVTEIDNFKVGDVEEVVEKVNGYKELEKENEYLKKIVIDRTNDNIHQWNEIKKLRADTRELVRLLELSLKKQGYEEIEVDVEYLEFIRKLLEKAEGDNKSNRTILKPIDQEINLYECQQCEFSLHFIEGTPQDNEYNYCPGCGRKIERGVE